MKLFCVVHLTLFHFPFFYCWSRLIWLVIDFDIIPSTDKFALHLVMFINLNLIILI
jgi:hypothetical protein